MSNWPVAEFIKYRDVDRINPNRSN